VSGSAAGISSLASASLVSWLAGSRLGGAWLSDPCSLLERVFDGASFAGDDRRARGSLALLLVAPAVVLAAGGDAEGIL